MALMMRCQTWTHMGSTNVGLGALMALATDSLNQSKFRGGRPFGFEPVCELWTKLCRVNVNVARHSLPWRRVGGSRLAASDPRGTNEGYRGWYWFHGREVWAMSDRAHYSVDETGRHDGARRVSHERLRLACAVANMYPDRPRAVWLSIAKVGSYLVDPASSHMLVSKIKPCMSKYKQLYGETANGSLNQL